MYRWLSLAALALAALAAPAAAAGLTGLYVEARTCDVWTGACFGNAEMNLTGRNAILAWKVERGALDGARLDGLAVVAVVAAPNTLGSEPTGPAQAVLIVDARADAAQQKALRNLARQQGGELVRNVLAVQTAEVRWTVDAQQEDVLCLEAGTARLKTRALDKERDRVCGGEGVFYPPLTKNVQAHVAVATEQSYHGKVFGETWNQRERRSVYLGRFDLP